MGGDGFEALNLRGHQIQLTVPEASRGMTSLGKSSQLRGCWASRGREQGAEEDPAWLVGPWGQEEPVTGMGDSGTES